MNACTDCGAESLTPCIPQCPAHPYFRDPDALCACGHLVDDHGPFCPYCSCDPIHDERVAREDGRSAGHAAGTWVICNIDEREARETLAAIDDGDPAAMDRLAPHSGWLSGEWADDPTPATLAREADCDDPDCIVAMCDAFEFAAEEAYWG